MKNGQITVHTETGHLCHFGLTWRGITLLQDCMFLLTAKASISLWNQNLFYRDLDINRMVLYEGTQNIYKFAGFSWGNIAHKTVSYWHLSSLYV